MGSFFKAGIFAVAVGLLIWGANQARTAVAQFAYKVVGYGKPSIKAFILQVPIIVRFTNPLPLGTTIDRFIADVFLKRGNQYQWIGKLDQAVTIPTGVSDQVLVPALDLQRLISGNILDVVNQLSSTGTIELRTDVTAIYGGIALPTQSFTNKITL